MTLAVRLQDLDAPHGIRAIDPLLKFPLNRPQERLYPRRLDLLEGHPVHPRRASVRPRPVIRVLQDVQPADLVVQGVEAKLWFLLRLGVQPPLEAPNPLRS